MPYQNLDSALMLAIGIWLLALLVFALMLVVVVANLISENRSQNGQRAKERTQTTGKYSLRRRLGLPTKESH